VVVYERNVEVGGLLRYGIPTMKLGKDVRTTQLCVSVCVAMNNKDCDRLYIITDQHNLLID